MDRTLDARGWLCPLPVMKASELVAGMVAGERLVLTATDPATMRDVREWVAGDPRLALESQERSVDRDGGELFVHRVRLR